MIRIILCLLKIKIKSNLFFFAFFLPFFFLDELNQTTTLVKPKNAKSIKVNVDVQEIGNMKLHVSNLLRGRTGLGTLFCLASDL